MIVLVYGAAHRAQGIVAVGKRVRQGKVLHPAGAGGLYDAYIGDVVGNQGVKADVQAAVALQYALGQCAAGHLICLYHLAALNTRGAVH